MKIKTENYCDTPNMLGWLTCVIPEVKRHAPMADTPTLFLALEKARANNELGKMKILQRELFNRLEPGDKVYTTPFFLPLERNFIPVSVTEWTKSGKYVHLENYGGCWGWDDIQIVNPWEVEE